MTLLMTASIAFFVTHLGIASTPLRGWLRNKLGTKGYLLCYSLVSILTLGIMIHGYIEVPHTDFLWAPTALAYQVTKVLLLMALVLLVMGILARNPTQVMNEEAFKEDATDNITGILKITRHPIQWSIALFAVGHLLANGDLASIWFFGTLAGLSLVGMLAMDARHRQEASPQWQQFMANTSMLPFVALACGKTRMTLADINWLGLLAGFGLYAAVYWFHDIISGISIH